MNVIKPLFWNPDEHRPRLLWRLLGQLLLLVALLLPLDALVGTLPLSPAGQEAAAGITAFTLSVWAARRLLDRRPWHPTLTGRAWAEFTAGLAWGAALMGGVLAVGWAAGAYTLSTTGYVAAGIPSMGYGLLTAAVAYMSVSVTEELLFRAYWLPNLAQGLPGTNGRPAWRTVAAVGASSTVFGLAHAGNNAASLTSTLLLIGLGVLFAVGYLVTGRAALPIGLHFSWNFVQGNVLGLPVSGWPVEGASLMRVADNGPAWLTGGSFGPEAGALGAAAIVVGCVLLWWAHGGLADDWDQ